MTNYTKYGILQMKYNQIVPKKLDFIGSSRRDIKGFPEEVKQKVVLAFYADALQEELARKKVMVELKEQLVELLKEFDKADAAEGK